MASVLSHPAVPLALGLALGPDRVPPALVVLGCVASILPDVDSLGFAAGVPYGHPLGHRSVTHSLSFAAVVAALVIPYARRLGVSPSLALGFLLVSIASHGVLDAMTSGGLGVAFLSPFSNERYFLPWRVILVSPIGIGPFLSRQGLQVLKSEAVWIWGPSALFAALGVVMRRFARFG
ncbi:MAG TPA: metal-dependent hydrolase [Thermoanaerobaculia bacterium]|nr:metal-dependent hydrolase [Thermoanaerobaculia bacterium]